jgi:hypothetical protein
MTALEVFVNGHQVCLAGVGEEGVLSAIVDWVNSPHSEAATNLSVGGLDSNTGEHLHWDVPSIGIGAEVLVRVVEASVVDPPGRRYRLQGQSAIEEIREHLGDLVERTTEEERQQLLRELIQRLESH